MAEIECLMNVVVKVSIDTKHPADLTLKLNEYDWRDKINCEEYPDGRDLSHRFHDYIYLEFCREIENIFTNRICNE